MWGEGFWGGSCASYSSLNYRKLPNIRGRNQGEGDLYKKRNPHKGEKKRGNTIFSL